MIIYNSSSTGTSGSYQFPDPVTELGIQTNGTGTFSLEGSIGGAWAQIVASSTYASGTINQYSTGFITSRVRAVVSVVGTTDFQIHAVGR